MYLFSIDYVWYESGGGKHKSAYCGSLSGLESRGGIIAHFAFGPCGGRMSAFSKTLARQAGIARRSKSEGFSSWN